MRRRSSGLPRCGGPMPPRTTISCSGRSRRARRPASPARRPNSWLFRRPSWRMRHAPFDRIGLAREADAEAADDVLELAGERPELARLVAQLGDAIGDPAAQRGDIDAGKASVLQHHAAADHHAVDGAAILAMDKLVHGVVERDEIGMVEIEEDDVGLIAWREAADRVAEAEGAGAAFGRHGEHLLGAQPAAIIGAKYPACEGGEAHR